MGAEYRMPAPNPRGEWHGPWIVRALLAIGSAGVLAVTIAIGLAATQWIGRPFPGFFVLPNRVIASIGLPSWSGSRDGVIYQRTVITADGLPIRSNADVYRRVAERPVRSLVDYSLRSGAATQTLAIQTELFSRWDYWLVFGGYVMTGALYLLLAVLGSGLRPSAHLGRALLCVGSGGGMYALSAVGIYGAGGSFRTHALVEAFLPTAFIYLAVVFPRERRAILVPVVAAAWCLSLALAIPYQLLLHQPGAYSLIHAACEVYLGAAGVLLIASLIVEYARAGDRADSLLRAATAGALLGIGVPTVVLMLSGISGGAAPVNVCTVTSFLFPLCFGVGLVRGQTLGAGSRQATAMRTT